MGTGTGAASRTGITARGSASPWPAPPDAVTRPAWLLPEPQALTERQSKPWLDGAPLQLLAGPERIEAGWWDGALASRDYFVAQAAGGALVWVYRTRLVNPPTNGDAGVGGDDAGSGPNLSRAEGWFLQGRFA